MDSYTLYFLVGLAVIAALVLLYPIFFQDRKSKAGPKDQLNWVDKTNDNIAAPDVGLAEIKKATPEEAREIAHKLTSGPDAAPVSNEEFYALNAKLGGPGTSQEQKEALSHPERGA